MRFRCPHCSQPIELVPESESKSIVCPSCGSEVGLISEDEATATLSIAELPALQHFQLIEEIGMGQFGRVWKAKDIELQRLVAIKIPHKRKLTQTEASYFLREARSAAKLTHPHIVTVYEVGMTDHSMYIVSELIDGPTMREWRKQHQPDVTESARVCATVARALDYAHSQGIVHRDLKPSNIILDEQRQPHVTDFGLAKQEGAEATIAITGQVLGTPAYMAPEQIRDGHLVDGRSDVYSLGVILYELITGKRPFKGGRRILFQHVLYDDPRPPRAVKPDLPRDLETICLKALEKSPDDRYSTAAAFADDLERFLKGETIHARPTPTVIRAARWARRRPAVVASAVLALLVLILLPLAFLKPAPAPAPAPQPEIRGPVVAITTEPEGAEVIFVPIDETTGRPDVASAIHAGKSPVRRRMVPAFYLVVAYTADKTKFHEVYRDVRTGPSTYGSRFTMYDRGVAEDGTVHLHPIRLFSQEEVIKDMVRVTGGQCLLRDLTGHHQVTLPDFYVSATETSYAMARAAGVSARGIVEGAAEHPHLPVTVKTWNEAAHLAEQMGARLLLSVEYEYLEKAGGTQTSAELWKDAQRPTPGPVTDPAWDRLEWVRLSAPLIGIRSNVLEWTDSHVLLREFDSGEQRVVRGGVRWSGQGPPQRLPPPPVYVLRHQRPENIGFRCARSVAPRVRPSDFAQFNTERRKGLPGRLPTRQGDPTPK